MTCETPRYESDRIETVSMRHKRYDRASKKDRQDREAWQQFCASQTVTVSLTSRVVGRPWTVNSIKGQTGTTGLMQWNNETTYS